MDILQRQCQQPVSNTTTFHQTRVNTMVESLPQITLSLTKYAGWTSSKASVVISTHPSISSHVRPSKLATVRFIERQWTFCCPVRPGSLKWYSARSVTSWIGHPRTPWTFARVPMVAAVSVGGWCLGCCLGGTKRVQGTVLRCVDHQAACGVVTREQLEPFPGPCRTKLVATARFRCRNAV